MDKLTELPPPEKGSKEELAYEIIDMILNCMLNRHIHILEENGYLKTKKYHKEYGWDGARKKKALSLKHELMDEAQVRFAEQIAKSLKEPPTGELNLKLWKRFIFHPIFLPKLEILFFQRLTENNENETKILEASKMYSAQDQKCSSKIFGCIYI